MSRAISDTRLDRWRRYDDSPLYRVEVRSDGTLNHSGAFDPQYECECELAEGRHLTADCAAP